MKQRKRRYLHTEIERSKAMSSNIAIPAPEGKIFRPFQKAGIAYAAARENTLLADEMGTGKTIQSIGLSNLTKPSKVLIICPATLKSMWKSAWKVWSTINHTVDVIEGTKSVFPDSNVVILNYELLKAHRAFLRQETWDLMILDESHYLKRHKTDRTMEVLGGIKRNPDKTIKERISPIPTHRALFLTGTPILNKPKDLWTLVSAIDPNGLGSDWFKFAKRYCQLKEIMGWKNGKPARIGWWWDGADNLSELQQIMRERFMIRRLKSDVLKELPAKIRQVIPITPKSVTLKKLCAEEMRQWDEYLNTHILPRDTDIPVSPELREKIALQKVPYVIEYLQGVLDEQKKIVVFAHHHSVIDKLAEEFAGICAVIDGRTPSKDRASLVQRFQEDDSCRVFIGGIQAAGVGITLTAASVAVFAEFDWVPANLNQAEDRLHRIGQTQPVQIIHVVLEGSLDEEMIQTVIGKQEIIEEALNASTPLYQN